MHCRSRVLCRTLIGVPIASLMLLAIFAIPSAGQKKSAEPPKKTFECRWTDLPIQIDGKADEEAWKDAQVIDDFYLPWLGKNARPSRTKTKARLIWDRDNLYFFAEMED